MPKVSVVISQQICIADYIYINADDLAALYLDYSATQMHEIFNKSLQKGINILRCMTLGDIISEEIITK